MIEPEVLAEMAAMRIRDEFQAMNRDYAELCWTVYDKFLRAGFDEVLDTGGPGSRTVLPLRGQ